MFNTRKNKKHYTQPKINLFFDEILKRHFLNSKNFINSFFLILKQIILLEESWSEIFLLCALQWSIPMENNPFLSVNDYSPDKSNLRLMNEVIMKFKMLNVDAAEFTYLKAIVLFKSGKLIYFLFELNWAFLIFFFK